LVDQGSHQSGALPGEQFLAHFESAQARIELSREIQGTAPAIKIQGDDNRWCRRVCWGNLGYHHLSIPVVKISLEPYWPRLSRRFSPRTLSISGRLASMPSARPHTRARISHSPRGNWPRGKPSRLKVTGCGLSWAIHRPRKAQISIVSTRTIVFSCFIPSS